MATSKLSLAYLSKQPVKESIWVPFTVFSEVNSIKYSVALSILGYWGKKLREQWGAARADSEADANQKTLRFCQLKPVLADWTCGVYSVIPLNLSLCNTCPPKPLSHRLATSTCSTSSILYLPHSLSSPLAQTTPSHRSFRKSYETPKPNPVRSQAFCFLKFRLVELSFGRSWLSSAAGNAWR